MLAQLANHEKDMALIGLELETKRLSTVAQAFKAFLLTEAKQILGQ